MEGQKCLDISRAEHIEVHISIDGKRLWVNDEVTCLLRVCRIKNLYLQDDRSRKEGWVIELLKSLDKDETRELLGIVSLIADPLSQELLKWAAEE